MSHKGFTVIELLVAITVAVLLLGLGVPAMGDFLASQRQRSASHSLVTDLNYARHTAVHSGVPVVICPSLDLVDCGPEGAWHQGWIVFADPDNDRSLGPDESLLRAGAPAHPALSIRSSDHRRRIRFLPLGFAMGSNVTITLCDHRGADSARAIIVSNTGRMRSDGRAPDGGPLSCPEA